MSDAEFRNFARAALEKFLPADRRGGMADFLNRLSYQALDVTTAKGYGEWRSGRRPEAGLAIFLSTAPSLFEPTIKGLRRAG
jgi:glucose-6-phosphate 1-dehydrogenase